MENDVHEHEWKYKKTKKINIITTFICSCGKVRKKNKVDFWEKYF